MEHSARHPVCIYRYIKRGAHVEPPGEPGLEADCSDHPKLRVYFIKALAEVLAKALARALAWVLAKAFARALPRASCPKYPKLRVNFLHDTCIRKTCGLI